MLAGAFLGRRNRNSDRGTRRDEHLLRLPGRVDSNAGLEWNDSRGRNAKQNNTVSRYALENRSTQVRRYYRPVLVDEEDVHPAEFLDQSSGCAVQEKHLRASILIR